MFTSLMRKHEETGHKIADWRLLSVARRKREHGFADLIHTVRRDATRRFCGVGWGGVNGA